MMNRGFLLLGLVPWLMMGQTNTITASPYSLFGIGVNTKSNIGRNNVLGGGGYALGSYEVINARNPASFAVIPEHVFLYDIGLTAELSSISSKGKDEKRLAGNISSIALASPLSKRSGFGLTLEPYSDVGYALIGIQSNVEGTYDTFVSNVFGSGGLNDLKLNYGYAVNDKIRIGVGLSHIFGTLKETQRIQSKSTSLSMEDKTKYTGFRVDLGVQGTLFDDLDLGLRMRWPTVLKVRHDRKVFKTLSSSPQPQMVENISGETLPNFELPLELGMGLVYRIHDSWAINLDFSYNFWDATDQKDNIGHFVDQKVLGMGVEYRVDRHSHTYWKRIEFRAGLNRDSGYLKIYDHIIDGNSIMVGMGLPLSRTGRSTLNFSYGRNRYGLSQGILVEEIFNTFNINLSLVDLWFIKRKIN